MKRIILTLAALGLAGSLAACAKQEATTEAAPPVASAASGSNMAAMGMTGEASIAKGTGTVTAVSADSVTIDHAPFPEANWPAMTMGFKASEDLTKAVKVGIVRVSSEPQAG